MPIWPFQVSGPAQGEVPPFVPQPSSTRQVSSTGLSRRCCLRASPDRPTRLRLAVPKWTRRQGEETPLGPSSGEETPISQDGMSYRVRSLPSSLFHPSNRALPSDCVARVGKTVIPAGHLAVCLCVGACSVNLVGDTLFCTCMVCVAFSLLCMFCTCLP